MKKFILALCVITAACTTPKPAYSDVYEKEWYPGDTVFATSVCKTEKIILEVALADTKSEEATLAKIREFGETEDCLTIFPPMPFYVHTVVINYKDFKNRPSVVFSLRLVGDDQENIIGYAIGAGREGSI